MAPPNISETAATKPLDETPSVAENGDGVTFDSQPPPQRMNELEDISTMNVNMDQEDRDVWARSEGYTPLADFQGGSMMMMMSAPPSAASDDYNEENDNRHGGGGAFFVDLAAFGSAAATSYQDEDDDEEEEDDEEKYQWRDTEYCSALDNNESDEDFRAMAERALSSLDDEYVRTVHGEGETEPKSMTGTMLDSTEVDSLSPAVASVPLFLDGADEVDNGDNRSARPTKAIPAIDTDAVRRAVQAISLRDPNLIVNMSKWQEQIELPPSPKAVIAPPVHAIIPKAPLQAFRKRTAKAMQATANLTRSATLAEGLCRVLWSASNSTPSVATEAKSSAIIQKLIVHVVGVDHVECASSEHTRTSIGPFVRWLGASALAPRDVDIHLVGPNIPAYSISNATTSSVDLMPGTLSQRSNLQSAVATYHRAKYHDWWSIQKEADQNVPHLVVCFNAGIWGYDEWRPTLQILCNQPHSVPFVATAYTIQEAEDDWDVIRDVLAANDEDENDVEDRCLWNVELNAFASKVPRPTATAVSGRDYRENASWQAWKLGRRSTDS